MCASSIKKYILDDNVEKASSIVADVLLKSDDVNKEAFNILSVLSTTLAEKSKRQTVYRSSCDSIFKLAQSCCEALSKDWKCKRRVFMQYVYHICKHFISKNNLIYAKKLTLYFMSLNKLRKVAWDQDEKTVLNAIVKDFVDCLFSNRNPDLFGPDDESIVSWWNYVVSISQLNSAECLCYTFPATNKIFSKLSNTRDIHRLGEIFFDRYCKVIKDSVSSELPFTLKTPYNFSCLIIMVDNYFWAMTQEDLISLNHNSLISFLEVLSNSCSPKDSNMIEAAISLILMFKGQLDVDKCCNFLDKMDKCSDDMSASREMTCFTIRILHLLFSLLVGNKTVMKHISCRLFTLINNLNKAFIKCNSTNKKKVQDNSVVTKMFVLAMRVLENYGEDQQKLQTHYHDTCSMVKWFFCCFNVTSENSMYNLNELVRMVNKAAIAFNNAGYMAHAWQLTINFFKELRKLEFARKPPNYLKDNVSSILKSFVDFSVSSNKSFESMACLIALACDNSPLFKLTDVFKFWCVLKLHPLFKLNDTTVFHVINVENDGALEKTIVDDLINWPMSSVIALNHERLLLLEIQSYLKHKELMKSVLAVYKTAVTNVQCRVTQARILCCAAKAVMENSQDFILAAKFNTSLQNLVKIISSSAKGKTNLDEIDKALVLGDLYYCLAKYKICCLRKFAQAQVVNLQTIEKVDDLIIPLTEDPLNCTVITNEFSFIAYHTQEDFMKLLTQAQDAWSQALVILQCTKLSEEHQNKVKEYEFSVSCSLKYMKEVGYVFRLYKDVKREAVHWQLLYDITLPLPSGFPKYRIIAFSELLCSLTHIEDTIVDKMKEYVESQPGLHNTYYYHLFYISLGKNKLFSHKLDESKEILDQLKEMELIKLKTVYVQYKLYSYWLRSAVGIPDYKRPRELIRIFELTLAQSKIPSRSFVQETLDNCLLLDLVLLIGRRFYKIRDVRYARLYSNKQLELAQELHLPIRTCELLILQCEIDLICGNSKDVMSKLSRIETVLEISPKSVGYNLHPANCSCGPCTHLEYQIALVYAHLINAGLCRLQQASSNSLTILKDCQALLSKIKKNFNRNYVSELLDCDISFNVMAMELLVDWGRYEKACKYSDHAMSYIKRNYKPCHSEVSVISFVTALRLKLPLPKLQTSVLVQLTPEKELELAITPLANSRNDGTPPPVGWKVVCSPNENKFSPPVVIKLKQKKLVFDNSPNGQNNLTDLKSKTNLPSDDTDFADKRLNSENQCSGAVPVKTKQAGKSKKAIPAVVITDCQSDKTSEYSHLEKFSVQSGVQDKYLKIPDRRLQTNNCKMNSVTPTKVSVPVYCDNKENMFTDRRKKKVQKKTTNNAPEVICILSSSDEDGEEEATKSHSVIKYKKINRKYEEVVPHAKDRSPRRSLFPTKCADLQNESVDSHCLGSKLSPSQICGDNSTNSLKDISRQSVESHSDISVIDETINELAVSAKIQLMQTSKRNFSQNKPSSEDSSDKQSVSYRLSSSTNSPKGSDRLSGESCDDASIIDATIYEPAVSPKVQFTPQIDMLQIKLSKLHVSPTSPLAMPLVTPTPVKTYSRKLNIKSEKPFRQQNQDTGGAAPLTASMQKRIKTLLTPSMTPATRETQTSKRLLRSSSKRPPK